MSRTKEPVVSTLYGRKIARARAALLWERLWPALLPLGGVAGVFLVLSLLDLWRELPGWLHILGLAGFAAAGIAALWWAGRGWRPASYEEARRRLERASGFDHRPLLALEDDLVGAGTDSGTRALWEAHLELARAAIRHLRVGRPRTSWMALDPFGLRAALLILLAVGLAVANTDAPRRLKAAFSPALAKAGEPPPRLDAWINPPAYTGLPPVFLTREDGPIRPESAVRVPAGAKLVARLHGGRGEAALTVDAQVTPFQAIDSRNRQIEKELTAAERVTVRQGDREVAAWPISIVPDRPPTIAFTDPPAPTPRLALEIAYEANDDYGLGKAWAEIRRDGAEEVLSVPLPLSGASLRRVTEKSAHDLTEHLWAGLDVSIVLVAEDSIGQQGRSEPVAVKLPERPFRHPVARALVEQRRLLSTEPGKRGTIVRALAAMTLIPDSFNNDTTVYLGLRTAGRRLSQSDEPDVVGEMQKLMWDLALRLEDGNLSLAERALRDAERALREALDRNAPDSEIQKLTEDLRKALDQFLQALAEQMEKQAQEGGDQFDELPPDARVITRDDLMRMLDQMRDMSRSGARDAARDMLSQLQRMLENLKNARPGRPQPGQQNQAMREMGELLRKQQELLDQTFRRSQRGQQQGQQGEGQEGGDSRSLAERQEELRRMLEEMMRRLGQGQQPGQQGEGQEGQQGQGQQPGEGQGQGQGQGALGRAERSMRDARDALGQGRPGSAVGPQSDALDQLREGLRGMMDQMMGQGEGPDGRPPQGSRENRAGADREDPLGRPLPGEWDSGDSTKVPEKGELQRSREILEELLRRAGEGARPLLEREYIDRLLRRF